MVVNWQKNKEVFFTNWIVCLLLEFFLNGAELSVNSANTGNLINHWSMNWTQFKDPVSSMCLAGTVVGSWSLTQEVAGSNPFNDKYFCYRIHWIQWKWSYLASLVFGKNCRKIRVNTSRPESKTWWHQAYAPIRKQYLWGGAFPTSWIFIKNPLVTSSLFRWFNEGAIITPPPLLV